ncbi:AAA family ATPase [Sphingomonas sp. KRR8]|uniref:AAA family ATPase n=1 Tax=Sphingomonas sp. KRR8 TaxID=2942996 RepID=UPI002021BE3F|nr:AAA family ATPase [Sphingomonas sp. KRR8]URD61827.1 AAA family ATPase [Sphingomonas sp. KRR8]
MTFAAAFFDEMDRREERAHSLQLGDPITLTEWNTATPKPRTIIDRWFYEDVGVFIAPGGTGKTTLLLFQIIHLILGLDLFGLEVRAPGPVIIITAEDSRETLIARLRFMCHQLNLTDEQKAAIREGVIITDVSGRGLKLTTVEKDVVMPSKQLDRLIVEVGLRCPSLLIFDPMVSFGVGESRINDAEQGLIEAGRRIRNAVGCGVIYVHHTGKANARDESLDQYSGRGGSALADGARMIHVLQRLQPGEWTSKTGDILGPKDSGFVLARPKMTWCEPQPHLYIKRQGFVFDYFEAAAPEEAIAAMMKKNAELILQLLKDEYLKGTRHTGRTLEAISPIQQKQTRLTLQHLLANGLVVNEKVQRTGRGGASSFLRPLDVPMTT